MARPGRGRHPAAGGAGNGGTGGEGQEGDLCSVDADCAGDLLCFCFNDGCHDCGGPNGTCSKGCFGG